MATIGTLAVNLICNTSVFDNNLRRSLDAVEDIKRKAEKMRFHFEPSRDIYRQMETRAALEERLYQATHTQQEIALRDSMAYFNRLKTEWANNEQMMTIITQLETATRKQIMENYTSSSISNILKIRAAYVRAAKVGIIARLGLDVVGGLAQSIADFKTEGFSKGFETLIRTIPLLGNAIANTSEKIANMFMAFTDFKTAEEIEKINEKSIKLRDTFDNIQTKRASLEEQLTLSRTPKNEQLKTSALTEYKKELKDIIALAAEWRRLTGKSGKAEFESLKAMALENYQNKIAAPFEELKKSLIEQYILLGMTDRQIKMYNAGLLGLDSSQLKVIDAILADIEKKTKIINEQKERENALDELAKSAERLKESLKTPVEKFKELRTEYEKMLKLDLINQQQFDKAVRMAAEQHLALSKDVFSSPGEAVVFNAQQMDIKGLSTGTSSLQGRLLEESQKQTASLENIENALGE